jgi:hypothetical protein
MIYHPKCELANNHRFDTKVMAPGVRKVRKSRPPACYDCLEGHELPAADRCAIRDGELADALDRRVNYCLTLQILVIIS